MADINSNLPTRDTSDGSVGAAVPSIAIQIAGKNNSGNLTPILIDAQGGAIIAGEGTAGTPTGGVVTIQGVASGTSVPISAAALPLPAGAASAANQATEITALTSIVSTSNSTAVNTNAVMANQTNGTQKTLITDVVGDIFRVTSVDSTNSTATVLGANATFTGTFFDAINYSTLSLLVFTDQVSATNGLTIQYSTDGTNIDDNDQYTVPASNGQQYSFPLAARYYRVVYTNGAVTQGAFRLQCKTHSTPIKPSSERVKNGASGESDAELVMNVNGRLPLIASAPATASIGVASTTVIAANIARKGLVIQNVSSLAIVSLNLVGGSAVLNQGITLYPHDIWYMDEWTFTNAQINAISSIAATPVGIQELIS